MSDANSRRWALKLAAVDANMLVALDALLSECHVTRAAARMGVTQSAMSQTLGRLREQFDDPILARVGRRMEPTPFALRIHPRLRQAIRELEHIVQDRPAFDPASASRRFVVSTVDYVALVLVPPLNSRIGESAPGVSLAVHAPEAGSTVETLEAGVADLYIGVRGEAERGLSTKRLWQEPFRVVVRRGHPLVDSPAAEDYVRFPHIHVSPRREPGSVVDRALAERGLTRPIAAEVPYFALVPGLLQGSDLVATVPGRFARWLETQHPVVSLEPPVSLGELTLYMAWHPRFDGEPGLTWLREQVEELDPVAP
jgi:DNA-binding transcriptional LysR family regulator